MEINFDGALRKVLDMVNAWDWLNSYQTQVTADESERTIKVEFISDNDAMAFAMLMSRTKYIYVRSVEYASVTLAVIRQW